MSSHCTRYCDRPHRELPYIGVDLHTSIDTVPLREWRQIVDEGRVFLSPGYLNALEASGINLRHAVFHRGGRPVGVASFQVMAFKGAPLQSYINVECPFVGIVSRAVKAIRAPFSSTLLICGTPFASGEHGYAFAEDVSHADIAHALATASQRVQEVLSPDIQPSGVLFKEFSPLTAPIGAALDHRRFSPIKTDPAMVLPISEMWGSFDDYLSDLSSKYRVKAKRAFAKSADLTVKPLTGADIERYAETIGALYAGVVERAPFKLGHLGVGTLLALREKMGDTFILQGYFLGSALVGFLTAFENGPRLEAGFVGIDYRYNPNHAIYPRMLYDYLLLGIERKCRAVNYGRTAGEIKSTLGAVPVQMTCAVKLNHSALNMVLRWFKSMVKPTTAVVRRPFKKAWYAAHETILQQRSATPELFREVG